VRAGVPDHGRRVLLLGRRWRRGRRRAAACPSMGGRGRPCGLGRRIGWRNPRGTPWTKSPQHQQRQGRNAERSKQENRQKADPSAPLARILPGARAGRRCCARRPGGTGRQTRGVRPLAGRLRCSAGRGEGAQVFEGRCVYAAVRTKAVLHLEPLDRRLRAGSKEAVDRARPVAEPAQAPLNLPDPLGTGRAPVAGTRLECMCQSILAAGRM
jgi:hypothetical protein